MRSFTLASALAALSTANAHGYLSNVTANGVVHDLQGILWPYNPTVKDAGWRAGNSDSGFVTSNTEYINSPAISCHHQNGSTMNALPALPALGAPVPVNAGSVVDLTWHTWAGHPGPTIDYLGKCPGACNALQDATQIEWFKIRESGLKAGMLASAAGAWETTRIAETAGVQSVTIPASLAPGEYILRHEVIALHAASGIGGAQLYPFCINLAVSGTGTLAPAGITADKFYTQSDPGILLSIYSPPVSNYTVPGPALPPFIVNMP